MANNEYLPGQRWVSTTEADLGLGIVVENTGRLVEIAFPAAGERRTYAIDQAPLSRIVYREGEQVTSIDDVTITVMGCEADEYGILHYAGTTDEGDSVLLAETELDSFVRFSKPQDRLFSGQIDKNRHFELRAETLRLKHRLIQSPAYGLIGGRVQPLKHQFYIANQVASRHAPRVLLADEVGLGKTIEAGLILHQQLIRGLAERALILLPDSLMHQWLVEMLRRFNLQFTILDENRCLDLQESGFENPFESAQLVLCPLSFLEEYPERREQAEAAGWDLLIVDEAHHLEWHEDLPSESYLCVEALAAAIPGLLLLTATPEQLGVEGHFARLRLLDPARYHDLNSYLEEESDYREVSDLVELMMQDTAASQIVAEPEKFSNMMEFLGEQATEKLLTELATGDADASKAAIDHAVSQLLDQHGTGRVLFRNTRDAIAGFPERKLTIHSLPQPTGWQALTEQAELEQQLRPESLLGDGWMELDSRVSWLTEWLEEHRSEKTLVICANASTAQALEERLRTRAAIRSSVFHEGLSLVERDRAAAWFADREADSAQALICSEIGSEGRNFQFASHLVLFDLPLNPDLLEQRIGRLDRIGQKNTVQIHLPAYEHSATEMLANWYHKGINAFETPCPAGLQLFDQLEQPLRFCLANAGNVEQDETFAALMETSQQLAEETRLRLQEGRDRLLELNSCQPAKAEALLEEFDEAEFTELMASYFNRVLDQFGVTRTDHSEACQVITPSAHMTVDSLPGLSEDGITVTYDREHALSREDVHLLTWEHPIAQGAMEIITDGEFGNTSLVTLHLPPLPAGSLLVETLYTLHCPAPKSLQLQRYLDTPYLRFVMNDAGKSLGHVLIESKLNKRVERIKTGKAREMLRHIQQPVEGLLLKSGALAKVEQQKLLDQALEKMHLSMDDEIERLVELAKVNPNIRAEEIEKLMADKETLQSFLQHATVQLDSLRVIVVV
ncbi:RNA polymerase-associated protein RapA [Pelagibaculum spongiae]|uniref:RNA polymerase-associated protein RapA n=1 Tax=Pelagibaculum spongiae TaxID=2080658 RepID=A0A2V1GTB9_9GAMM|nr:RNA polymerase-associated protein RapA [Pelagibaculum spongiae]